MKQYLALGAIAIGLLSSNLSALNSNDGVSTKLKHGNHVKVEKINSKSADDLESMFTNGTVGGQIRFFYIDRQYQGSAGKDTHRNAMTIGGHLDFETAAYNGLSLGTSFYTTNDIGIFDYAGSSNSPEKDPSLLGPNNDSMTYLGEAFVKYRFDKTALKFGRQKYSTPMMGPDDSRMLANLFEVYKLTNSDINNVNIQVAHITKFAQGTFGRVYNAANSDSDALLSSTSGVSGVDTRNNAGKFVNMGTYAVGKKTDGVTNIQVTYVSDSFHVKVSNDYAWDLYNTLYAETGMSWNFFLSDNVKPFLKAQAIKQNSVGGKYMKNLSSSDTGEIDSFYYAAKIGINYYGLTTYIAYSQTTKNDASDKTNNPYANAIVTQFGGMPAYTQGMVSRHQFFAGTKATKVAASYSFKPQGIKLSTAAYYTSFNMDENSGYGIARTAYESGFDIKYYPANVKNLQVRFRGNFPRKFADAGLGNTGWSEYRFLINYNF